MEADNETRETVQVDRVALVVLAAGRSSRMGYPKPLVPLAGLPLLEHVLGTPLVRHFGDVVVVLGHCADAIRPIVARCRYRHILNPQPELGRTTSIQAGLAALGPDILAAFIQPVDCPLILPRTYEALIASIESADVAIPSYYGEHGHPPLLSRSIFPRILAADGNEPLCDILRCPTVCRRFVEVHDIGVLMNINHPEDLPGLEDLYASRCSGERIRD